MARDMVEIRRPSGNKFAQEPQVKIGRSQFDRSHGNKLSFDASYLYPILLDEILPGDTFTCKLHGFARIFSPLDAPVMDNIELETFFFFVPSRLLWDNWAFMNGEHDAAGAQDTVYSVPQMAAGLVVDHDNSGYAVANLAAYLGLPDGLDSNLVNVNSLPFRAYNQIFSHWFRDQNVSADLFEGTADTADTPSNFALKKSAKKHDYFTSALPYLQKGTAQTVVLSGVAPVEMAAGQTGDTPSVWGDTDGKYKYLDRTPVTLLELHSSEDVGGTDRLKVDAKFYNLDVNALRQSVAIQRLLERDARGGTRYTEIIKSHFGVTSPDFRLQNPEYLGGGKSFLSVSAVANTSDTASADQGELRGVGTGMVTGSFAKSFTEHGYLLGLIRARGDVTYFQGMDKLWTRFTRYDFYIPALAHLGEQSVLNKEIFVSNVAVTDDAVFGYQERWSEYRYKASKITGLFNPDVSGSLSHWHLAEDFASLPALNTVFIEDSTPMARVTTVDTEHDFIADLWFDYKCARPIPVHSIPSLAGRF